MDRRKSSPIEVEVNWFTVNGAKSRKDGLHGKEESPSEAGTESPQRKNQHILDTIRELSFNSEQREQEDHISPHQLIERTRDAVSETPAINIIPPTPGEGRMGSPRRWSAGGEVHLSDPKWANDPLEEEPPREKGPRPQGSDPFHSRYRNMDKPGRVPPRAHLPESSKKPLSKSRSHEDMRGPLNSGDVTAPAPRKERSRYLDTGHPGRVPPRAHLPPKDKEPSKRPVSCDPTLRTQRPYSDKESSNRPVSCDPSPRSQRRYGDIIAPTPRRAKPRPRSMDLAAIMSRSSQPLFPTPSSEQIEDPMALESLLSNNRPALARGISLDELYPSSLPARYRPRRPRSFDPVYLYETHHHAEAGPSENRIRPTSLYSNFAPPRGPNSHEISSRFHQQELRISQEERNSKKKNNRHTHYAPVFKSTPEHSVTPPEPPAKMTPQCIALLEGQQRRLEMKMKRASVAYEMASRRSPLQDKNRRRSTGSHASSGRPYRGTSASPAESGRLSRDYQQRMARWSTVAETIEAEKRQQRQQPTGFRILASPSDMGGMDDETEYGEPVQVKGKGKGKWNQKWKTRFSRLKNIFSKSKRQNSHNRAARAS